MWRCRRHRAERPESRPTGAGLSPRRRVRRQPESRPQEYSGLDLTRGAGEAIADGGLSVAAYALETAAITLAEPVAICLRLIETYPRAPLVGHSARTNPYCWAGRNREHMIALGQTADNRRPDDANDRADP